MPSPIHAPKVASVAREAHKAALARDRMIAVMRDARESGVPLRDIAAAAGVSHEQVRRLVG